MKEHLMPSTISNRWAISPVWKNRSVAGELRFGASDKFSASQVSFLMALALALGFLFTCPDPTVTYIGWLVSICMMLGAVFLPVHVSLGIMLFMFVGPDILQATSEALEKGRQVVGSPWYLHFGPISPGTLLACIYGILVFRLRAWILPRHVKRCCYYFFGIGLAGLLASIAFHGGLPVPLDAIISDIRMPLFFIVSFLIWHAAGKRLPGYMYRYCQILLMVFLVRLIYDSFSWLTGTGASMSGAARAGIDSAKWTVLILMYWSYCNLIAVRHVIPNAVLLLLTIGSTIGALTRMIYLSCAAGFAVLLTASRNFRALIVGVPLILFLGATSLCILSKAMPDSYEIYMIRIGRLDHLMSLDFARADFTRYAQFINCFSEMSRDGTIICGRGFGGYYLDSIVSFESDLTDAFTDWSISTGRFYRFHNIIGFFVLKFGLIGLGFWLYLWYHLFARLYRLKCPVPHWETVRLLLLAIAPAVFASGYWSSKGMILTGFYFALGYFLLDQVALLKNQRQREITKNA